MEGRDGAGGLLDIEDILADTPEAPSGAGREVLGTSREGRPIHGFRLGSGRHAVSVIAGCHADEPVGPAMLDRLTRYLQTHAGAGPLLERFSFCVVPHVNPDGEARNAPWTDDVADLERYLAQVVREAPGDDIEFGFPRGPEDRSARPENRAVAAFLADHGPFALHGSFHGMAFAAGPWFLLEEAWIDRTVALRDGLRQAVADRGYVVHDIDRRGEKGFTRIDRGFTTRPDSRAMSAHFKALGDEAMAALFRPSSMEYVRSLGGDPLTLVSEMPLFLLPPSSFADGPYQRSRLTDEILRQARAMPVRDQMVFQLAFLAAALEAATVEGTAPLRRR